MFNFISKLLFFFFLIPLLLILYNIIFNIIYLVFNKFQEIQIMLISIITDTRGKIIIERSNTTDVLPFKSIGNNYGVMIEDLSKDFPEEELDEIFLLQCISGKCFSVPGYMKYNTASKNVKIAKCEDFCSLYQGSEKCDPNNSGKVFYDSVTEKFMICMNHGSIIKSVYEAEEIVSGSSINYYLNLFGKDDIYYYKLYISNKDGSIISRNNRGNFLFFFFFFFLFLFFIIIY